MGTYVVGTGTVVMGMGTEAVGMGTMFTGTGGDGVQFLSLCRPLGLWLLWGASECPDVKNYK